VDTEDLQPRHFHRGHAAIGIGLALVAASQLFSARVGHSSALRLTAFFATDLGGVICLCVGTWWVFRNRNRRA
jgi:hypothetical protein